MLASHVRVPPPTATDETPQATVAAATKGESGETTEAAPPARDPIRTALIVITVLLIIGALWVAQIFFIPLVLGILISYALDPIQRRLVQWHVPRALAATLVLTVVLVGLLAAAYAMRTQALEFVDRLPAFSQKVRGLTRWAVASDSPVAQVQQAAAELKQAAEAGTAPPRGVTRVQVEEPALRLSSVIWRSSIGIIGLVSQATIVLFLVFYLLANGDLYRRKLARIAGPQLGPRRVTVEILREIDGHIARFLMARVVISVMVGAATWLAFWALGVSEPIMWGIGAGVLNTIPYLGPVAFAAASAVAGLMQFDTGAMAATLAGVSVIIASIEGVLVTPVLMGRASRMNAGAVFVGLSFWGWIWGIWGLLLAVPILMVIKTVCEHIEGGAAIAELLSE